MIVFKFVFSALVVKADINAKGEAVFVADSVKSNPLAELFADEGNLDSDSLKALRVYFARDLLITAGN
jgi:hypothetical protein